MAPGDPNVRKYSIKITYPCSHYKVMPWFICTNQNIHIRIYQSLSFHSNHVIYNTK